MARVKLTDGERLARRRAKNEAYRKRNQQKIQAQQAARRKERRAADPGYAERSREHSRKYRDANKAAVNERARQKMREWRATPEGAEANRDKCRQYRAAHRDELLPKQRAKHHANRDANNETRKQHYYDHREENRPVRAGKLRQTRATSPWKFALNGAMQRAKKKGVPFDLTAEYLRSIWTGRCAVSGFAFQVGAGPGPKFRSPSLDRIDPATGYVRGNVRFVLWAVNALKAEATDAEMYAVARAMLDYRKNLSNQAITGSKSAARDVA